MTPVVEFDPLAEADVEQAREWYELRRDGLGDEFLDAVHDAVTCVQRLPHGYPVILEDVRSIVLKRFPYHLCYRVEPKRILVLAVYHSRMNPRKWRERF